ncbi:MAG: phosphate transporter ATP-binding protein [Candidatus Eremiobacteraeota bacterium]|nr:phosphate transporter ATP-binding protein [Candidatus Eremiobacteraeota bacterium]
MIELAGLRKTYRGPDGGVEALRGVDLTVERGEVFGVIGRSGAGKSTLLRCVNLLERPTAGRVVVDGVDLTALPPAALRDVRRGIGMIFQHFALLSSRTVRDNVALPLELAGRSKAEIADAVDPMLEFVGLTSMRDRFPAQLSGGQAQRVGIARALASRPSVLLCDEATSALDPETTQSILALLREVNRTLGVTIVLITHEMGVIKNVADRVAVIDAGRIVEEGAVRDVFLHPRAPITRTFVGEPTAEELSAMLGAPLGDAPSARGNVVWRLGFAESSARDSLVTTLIRRFPLELNIVSGTIERVGGEPLGTLVVELTADPSVRDDARSYLESVGVRVDILGYVERHLQPAS